MGFSVSRPSSLAVGSPSRVATYAWLNSWKVSANRSGGIIRRMPGPSPPHPPPPPSPPAPRGSLELWLVLFPGGGPPFGMRGTPPPPLPDALRVLLQQPPLRN